MPATPHEAWKRQQSCQHQPGELLVEASGLDIANIVAAAALFIAVYFVSKGSVKAFLVWIGILIALIYPYIIYAFAIHFNSLFLVYVAIVGLSFYTLVGSLMHLHLDNL